MARDKPGTVPKALKTNRISIKEKDSSKLRKIPGSMSNRLASMMNSGQGKSKLN
jgi:hypothetical protein